MEIRIPIAPSNVEFKFLVGDRVQNKRIVSTDTLKIVEPLAYLIEDTIEKSYRIVNLRTGQEHIFEEQDLLPQDVIHLEETIETSNRIENLCTRQENILEEQDLLPQEVINLEDSFEDAIDMAKKFKCLLCPKSFKMKMLIMSKKL